MLRSSYIAIHIATYEKLYVYIYNIYIIYVYRSIYVYIYNIYIIYVYRSVYIYINVIDVN